MVPLRALLQESNTDRHIKKYHQDIRKKLMKRKSPVKSSNGNVTINLEKTSVEWFVKSRLVQFIIPE